MVSRRLKIMEKTDLLDPYFCWECDKLSSVATFCCLYSVPKNLFPVVPLRGPKLNSVFLHWHSLLVAANMVLCLCSKHCNEEFRDKSSQYLHCQVSWKFCRFDCIDVNRRGHVLKTYI